DAVRRASGVYDVEDLLRAYRDHVGRPLYGLDAYRNWNEHVLATMSRAFGVSFSDERLHSLRTLIEADARLPHPTDGFIEDTLLNVRYEAQMVDLANAAGALHSLYER